jgi:hypothetical protein
MNATDRSITEAVLELFIAYGVSATGKRFDRALAQYAGLTDFERQRVRLCIVPYTFDTFRFGRASRRFGRAIKIGSGGQHKGKKPYLIFMDWSEEEKHE